MTMNGMTLIGYLIQLGQHMAVPSASTGLEYAYLIPCGSLMLGSSTHG